MVIVSTALRLVIAATTGLGVDESYAAAVALPFSWSYFDHPPLLFWLVGAMLEWSGGTHALVLRLPFVLCFTGTLWVIGRLGMQLFGDRAGVLGAVMLACTGVLGVTAGTWVLPDGPLLLGLSSAALLAAPALVPVRRDSQLPRSDPTRDSWRVAAAGFALGVAVLSKYHAALVALSVLVFLLTVPTARSALRLRGAPVALLFGALAALPVLWWNATHDWASFAFHGARSTTERAWSIAPFAESLAGQAAWLLPWVAPLAAAALYAAWRAGPRDPARWYCALLASGPILTFTLLTLTGARGLPHWQAPGWMFVMPLVGHGLDRALEAGRRWPLLWLRTSIVATMSLALVAASHAATGWLGPLVPSLASPHDPALDALDWRPLADSLRTLALDDHGIVARSWIQAGKLGVALGPRAMVECACDDPHHFAFRPTVPRDVPRLVIEHAQPWRRGWQPASIALADRLGPLDSLHTIQLTRGAQPAVSLVLYRPRADSAPAAAR